MDQRAADERRTGDEGERTESCCCESFGKIASLSFPSDTFSLSKESNQALVMFIPWRLE